MPTDRPFDQRKKPTLLRKWFFIPLILLVLVAFFPLLCLEVRDIDDNKIFFMSPVSRGENFEIRYIHSVEKTPVAGIFRVSDRNKIEVVESIFSSYGAGLPFDTTREDITFEGDRMRIRHRGIMIDHLRLFISPFTHQQFIYSQGRIDLSYVREGHIVEIKVRRIPLFWFWGWRFSDLLQKGFTQSFVKNSLLEH